MAEFCSLISVCEQVKSLVSIFGICGPKFIKFWDDVEDPLWFPIYFPTVYITFLSEAIHHRTRHQLRRAAW